MSQSQVHTSYRVHGIYADNNQAYTGGSTDIVPGTSPFAHGINHALEMRWYSCLELVNLEMENLHNGMRTEFEIADFKFALQGVASMEVCLPGPTVEPISQATFNLATLAAATPELLEMLDTPDVDPIDNRQNPPDGNLCGTGFTYQELQSYMESRATALQAEAGEAFSQKSGCYLQVAFALSRLACEFSRLV